MQARDPAIAARVPAPLRIALAVALGADVLAYVSLTAARRYFASEDDPYRLYNAWHARISLTSVVARFWLTLPGFLGRGLVALGVPLVWSGIVVATVSWCVLAVALARLTRLLAPPDLAPSGSVAAALLVACSPLALVLAHSSLVELPGLALVALAAWALAARDRGARRSVLVAASVAMTAASWMRYEAWIVAALLVPVGALVRFSRTKSTTDALSDGAVLAVSAVGPLAWMALQWHAYGSPIAFVARTNEISDALLGERSITTVAWHRVRDLGAWSWPVVAWSVVALVARRNRLRPLLVVVAVGVAPVVVQVLQGREFPVFVDRLVLAVELAAVPLAALGIAFLVRARPALASVALAATVLWLGIGVVRPAATTDTSSIAFGTALRDGLLDRELSNGALLVERPRARPPFGWASVGVLWEHFPRTLWAEVENGAWRVVESDRPAERAVVPLAQLDARLSARGVTAAWLLSSQARRDLARVWPDADVARVGGGWFVRARVH